MSDIKHEKKLANMDSPGETTKSFENKLDEEIPDIEESDFMIEIGRASCRERV